MSASTTECRDCWAVLGIAPTSDTRVIKRAYARLLRENNPEDAPEGFQNLRGAYEAALNQSKWIELGPDDDGAPELGHGRWMADEVYWAKADVAEEADQEDLSAREIQHTQSDEPEQVGCQAQKYIETAGPIEDEVVSFIEEARTLIWGGGLRSDVAKWTALLNSERLENLDLRARIGQAMYALFADAAEESGDGRMSLSNIPAGAWQKMDTLFGWSEDEIANARSRDNDWVDPIMCQVHAAWGRTAELEEETSLKEDIKDIVLEIKGVVLEFYWEITNELHLDDDIEYENDDDKPKAPLGYKILGNVIFLLTAIVILSIGPFYILFEFGKSFLGFDNEDEHEEKSQKPKSSKRWIFWIIAIWGIVSIAQLFVS